jgi:hypothetical protein
VKGNGTGPASRQLQDKVGGVVPAGLSLDRTARCHSGRGEYAMKNIADLLTWFWQGSQPVSNTQVAAMAENRDRSSMADFVRILQAYDQEPYGRG